LATYMLADEAKAAEVAEYFASFDEHQSHSLGIPRDAAVAKGLHVTNLEDDQDLQDAVLSVHHAALHTFNGLCVKLIENHLGRCFAKLEAPVGMQLGPPAQGIMLPLPTPPPGAP